MEELARIETVVFLQGVELFSACNAEQIMRISAIARQRRFAAGEPIYQAKDPAQALYCVVRGRVEIENGRGERHGLGPLSTLGVEEILSGRLRAESATAVESSLLLAVDAEDFFDLLANNIEIVRALFRQLLARRGDGEAGA